MVMMAQCKSRRGGVEAHGKRSWRARRWKRGRLVCGPCRSTIDMAIADLDQLLNDADRESLFRCRVPGVIEPHGNGYRARLSMNAATLRGRTRQTAEEAFVDLEHMRRSHMPLSVAHGNFQRGILAGP